MVVNAVETYVCTGGKPENKIESQFSEKTLHFGDLYSRLVQGSRLYPRLKRKALRHTLLLYILMAVEISNRFVSLAPTILREWLVLGGSVAPLPSSTVAFTETQVSRPWRPLGSARVIHAVGPRCSLSPTSEGSMTLEPT